MNIINKFLDIRKSNSSIVDSLIEKIKECALFSPIYWIFLIDDPGALIFTRVAIIITIPIVKSLIWKGLFFKAKYIGRSKIGKTINAAISQKRTADKPINP